jgi:quercetin dioxygenase-like cupin family protein
VSARGSIKDMVSYKQEGKSINVLFAEGFKAVGIGLLAKQKLEKHSTSTPAFLLVLEGSVEFQIDGTKYILDSQDFVKIPPSQEHEITALKNSKMILIK